MPKATPGRPALVSQALERFRDVADAETALRKAHLEDLKFASGEHWDSKIKSTRESDARPCLTIDRLSGPIKQVVNQIRQTLPAIQVNPVDSGADPDTAAALQGIIRRIETRSDALDAY